jgi:N-dimethylarginine dimethylaminohydrolase
MSEFEQVLKKYNVEVLRPTLIEDCNQVFSRDVGFVIEDEFFIANIIPDRLEELQAYREIKANCRYFWERKFIRSDKRRNVLDES